MSQNAIRLCYILMMINNIYLPLSRNLLRSKTNESYFDITFTILVLITETSRFLHAYQPKEGKFVSPDIFVPVIYLNASLNLCFDHSREWRIELCDMSVPNVIILLGICYLKEWMVKICICLYVMLKLFDFLSVIRKETFAFLLVLLLFLSDLMQFQFGRVYIHFTPLSQFNGDPWDSIHLFIRVHDGLCSNTNIATRHLHQDEYTQLP